MSWLLVVALAEAKKPKVPPPPPVGWNHEKDWKGDCYFPPNFEALPEGDRKMARQQTLEQLTAQWSGSREDGVVFGPELVDNVNTVLLGRPKEIEAVARKNLEMCRVAMTGGGTDGWSSWLTGLPAKLTAGECMQPLTYTLFDYINLGQGWQRPIPLCKGDRAKITATVRDRYRIEDKGEWITAEGDSSRKAVGAEYPCNIEGCFVGMLVGRFTTEAGVVTVFPIGAGTVFTAGDHGTLEWTVNDPNWYDNRWFKSGTIEDHTAVTIAPAE